MRHAGAGACAHGALRSLLVVLVVVGGGGSRGRRVRMRGAGAGVVLMRGAKHVLHVLLRRRSGRVDRGRRGQSGRA